MSAGKNAFEDNIRLAAETGAGDEDAAEKLLAANAGLVRSIAMRFCGRGAEPEDLLQLGNIGLIKAARSFDPSRGCVFSTYAVPLIMGEIRRYLRDNGQIKVSRTQKRLGARLLAECEKISSETGREAHISEAALRCGVSVGEAASALDAVSPVVSLSEPLGNDPDDGTLVGIIAADGDCAERTVERVALEAAVSRMPPLWKKITALRYQRELSQQKTAEILGVTQVKVSREEKKLLEFLRHELEG